MLPESDISQIAGSVEESQGLGGEGLAFGRHGMLLGMADHFNLSKAPENVTR